jgi:nucleoid-associated protein YgaU
MEDPDMADDPKAGAPVENPYTQWHEVVKGDTLSKIAAKYYGDASLYPKIFEANRDRIKNPDLIQVGWKLRIP